MSTAYVIGAAYFTVVGLVFWLGCYIVKALVDDAWDRDYEPAHSARSPRYKGQHRKPRLGPAFSA